LNLRRVPLLIFSPSEDVSYMSSLCVECGSSYPSTSGTRRGQGDLLQQALQWDELMSWRREPGW
jgi:hypothetical protein